MLVVLLCSGSLYLQPQLYQFLLENAPMVSCISDNNLLVFIFQYLSSWIEWNLSVSWFNLHTQQTIWCLIFLYVLKKYLFNELISDLWVRERSPSFHSLERLPWEARSEAGIWCRCVRLLPEWSYGFYHQRQELCGGSRGSGPASDTPSGFRRDWIRWSQYILKSVFVFMSTITPEINVQPEGCLSWTLFFPEHILSGSGSGGELDKKGEMMAGMSIRMWNI